MTNISNVIDGIFCLLPLDFENSNPFDDAQDKLVSDLDIRIRSTLLRTGLGFEAKRWPRPETFVTFLAFVALYK